MQASLLYLALHTAAMMAEEPEVSVVDLNRFPDRETVIACQVFAEKHRTWLSSRYCRQDEYQPFLGFSDTRADRMAWAEEAEFDWRCWSALRDAHGQMATNSSYWAVQHLYLLRKLLGRENYWAGRMPPAVPWYRFEMLEDAPYWTEPLPAWWANPPGERLWNVQRKGLQKK